MSRSTHAALHQFIERACPCSSICVCWKKSLHNQTSHGASERFMCVSVAFCYWKILNTGLLISQTLRRGLSFWQNELEGIIVFRTWEGHRVRENEVIFAERKDDKCETGGKRETEDEQKKVWNKRGAEGGAAYVWNLMQHCPLVDENGMFPLFVCCLMALCLARET